MLFMLVYPRGHKGVPTLLGSKLLLTMVLTHFSKERDVIFSIIEYGFVYFHNETNTLLPLVGKALNISDEPPSNGMVCFTDISIEHSEKHRQLFGNYGISISKSWAISKGAKKVTYLAGEGAIHQRLLKLYNEMCIAPIIRPKDPEVIRNVFASTEHMASLLGKEHSHTQFLEFLEWTQTDKHQSQSEWRVRQVAGKNADFFGAMAKIGKKDGVEKILNLKKSFKNRNVFPPQIELALNNSLTLELDDDAVINFICPKDDLEIFSSILGRTRFSKKPITPVSRAKQVQQ